MLGEQLGAAPVGGYGRPEEEYASENTKRFTVDSLLQIRRPDAAAAAAAAVDKRPITSYDGGKDFAVPRKTRIDFFFYQPPY